MNYRQPPAWRDLRIGIFFLASTILLLVFLFVVGTNQHLFTRHYDLKLYLGNTQGLSKGAQVTLSGLEVGRVTDIRFVERDTAQVLELNLSLDRSERSRITASSVATIRTVGVLGDKFIDISLGDPTQPPLQPGESLPVRGEIDWSETFARATDAIDDLTRFLMNGNETLERLNRGQGTLSLLLNDGETADRFRRTMDDLGAVSGSLRRGDGAAAHLISDPETFDKLDGILDRLARLTAEADTGSGALARVLGDEDLGRRLDELVAGSDSLVAAIRTQGTTGKLLNDEALYTDLTRTLVELRSLIEDLQKNPRKYFKVSVF